MPHARDKQHSGPQRHQLLETLGRCADQPRILFFRNRCRTYARRKNSGCPKRGVWDRVALGGWIMIYLIVAILLAVVAVLVFAVVAASVNRYLDTGLAARQCRPAAGRLRHRFGTCCVGFAQLSTAIRYHPIATVAFNKVDDRQFAIVLVDQVGNERRYELNGDLWQSRYSSYCNGPIRCAPRHQTRLSARQPVGSLPVA